MNRENLIEEAAKAMYSPTLWSAADEQNRAHYRHLAASALAVYAEAWSHERTVNVPRAEWERLKRFEQAHAKPFDTSPEPVKNGADSLHVTPTDDERELIEELRRCAQDSASGTHASKSPLLRGADLATRAADALERRTVQGEPTDAHVRAVWDALGPAITVAFEYEELRAALRAAGEVK